jgi:predicted pyridoxine 5'-phosphate oxidase superfamily flavin-nucleotide-binding protein
MRPMYNPGSRTLQDRFGSRALADRLEERLLRTAFTEGDSAFIQSRTMFFLATANTEGHPDCSYKGGAPGFVQVLGPSVLAFPSYDGNGMFRSLGNVLLNPHVGMLFIDFESPRRLRVNGRATITEDETALADFPGAELVVRVDAEAIFPNCPRYVHRAQIVEESAYTPREGREAPEPEWKKRPEFREVLPVPKPKGGPSE